MYKFRDVTRVIERAQETHALFGLIVHLRTILTMNLNLHVQKSFDEVIGKFPVYPPGCEPEEEDEDEDEDDE